MCLFRSEAVPICVAQLLLLAYGLKHDEKAIKEVILRTLFGILLRLLLYNNLLLCLRQISLYV